MKVDCGVAGVNPYGRLNCSKCLNQDSTDVARFFAEMLPSRCTLKVSWWSSKRPRRTASRTAWPAMEATVLMASGQHTDSGTPVPLKVV